MFQHIAVRVKLIEPYVLLVLLSSNLSGFALARWYSNVESPLSRPQARARLASRSGPPLPLLCRRASLRSVDLLIILVGVYWRHLRTDTRSRLKHVGEPPSTRLSTPTTGSLAEGPTFP